MPDYPFRLQAEQHILRQMAPLFRRQAREVASARTERRAAEWESFQAEMADVLSQTLSSVYVGSGSGLSDQLGLSGLGIESGLQDAGGEWARQKAFETASQVIQVSNEKLDLAEPVIGDELRRRVEQRAREGLPMSDAELERLRGQLWAKRAGHVFGQQRGEVIAATEVTGGISAGELAVAGLLVGGIAAAALLTAEAKDAPQSVKAELIQKAADEVVGRTVKRMLPRGQKETFTPETQRAVVRSIVNRGLENRTPLTIWWTEKDARVCPICRPMHKQPATFLPKVGGSPTDEQQTERWMEIVATNPALKPKERAAALRSVRSNNGPPAHPNCRCWKEYTLRRGERFEKLRPKSEVGLGAFAGSPGR